MHLMMRECRWHASQEYYALILTVVRQQLRLAQDVQALRSAWERLHSLQSEASLELDHHSRASLELVAAEMQCEVAAAARARAIGDEAADIRRLSLHSAADMFRTRVLAGLSSSSSARLEAAAEGSMASAFIQELDTQLSSSPDTSLPPVALFGGVGGRAKVSSVRRVHDDLTRLATRLCRATQTLLVELADDGRLQDMESMLSQSAPLLSLCAERESWLLETVSHVVKASSRSLQTEDEATSALSALAQSLHRAALVLAADLKLSSEETLGLRNKLEDTLSHSVVFAIPRSCDWRRLPHIVEGIHRSLGWHIPDKEKLNRSIVRQLCQYNANEAVARAIERLVADFGPIGPSDAPMLTSVLRAATDALSAKELRSFLRIFGERIDAIKDFGLQLARLHASAKLGDGYSALLHLRALEQFGGRRVPLSAFSCVVGALQAFEPRDESGEGLAADPKTSCEYIRELMLRQGHPMSAVIAVQLIGLFTKAAKLSIDKHVDPGRIFGEAIDFCESVESNGGLDLTAADRELVRSGLIKMFCVSGELDSAMKVLHDSRRLGLALSSVSYEPIIYFLCCIRLDTVQAEDVLTTMLNNDLTPSTNIVDSFVKGRIYTGDLKGALDAAQDLFNQHRVAPSIDCMEALLRRNLESSDLYESRRVAMMMDSFGLLASNKSSDNSMRALRRKTEMAKEDLERVFTAYGQKLQI